jgi:hypothetical protein
MRENRVIGVILSSRRSEAGETPFSRSIGNAAKPKKWQANSVTKRSLHRREFIRRTAVAAVATLAWPGEATIARAKATSTYQLASFTSDVTPPLGHALMGGGIAPAQRIEDPLFAHGFVLSNGGNPIVFVAVDWCEIRNDAYDRWRAVLAEAARTTRERVLVTSVHVHDAPVADLEAQHILEQHKLATSICNLDFHERALQRVARSLRDALRHSRRVSHLGIGQAKVQQVASNRRFPGPDGTTLFSRTSSTRDPVAHEAPGGTIDPWLKTLSFWDGDLPLAALSCYATHPMSYYGKGGVSSDFVGLARERRQKDDASVAQIYASGCSGNVTAGKYNDGSAANRPVLADRIYQAMASAWAATQRHPMDRSEFHSVSLRLEARNSPGFAPDDLRRRLAPESKSFDQCLAALGLSWRKRAEAGRMIDVPVIDFGIAQLLLLPGESYVEYQLLAQKLRPDSFVIVAGYGECAPGYIPTEQAWAEGDTNLRDWCWVGPGSEARMTNAIKAALKSG